MNIADRATLYAGVRRVLACGGRFAMHDAISGDAGPIAYPVPWASEMRTALEASGFEIDVWDDTTSAAIASFAPLARADAGPGAALALPGRNVREDRVRFVQSFRGRGDAT